MALEFIQYDKPVSFVHMDQDEIDAMTGPPTGIMVFNESEWAVQVAREDGWWEVVTTYEGNLEMRGGYIGWWGTYPDPGIFNIIMGTAADGVRYALHARDPATGEDIPILTERLQFAQSGPLTLAADGSLTLPAVPTGCAYQVDTFGSVGSDTLECIVGGALGDMILISPYAAGRDIIIQHDFLAYPHSGAGRIWCMGERDITLSDPYDFAILWCSQGTSGNWTAMAGRVPAVIQDADGDTKIQVEEAADEDIIRFDCFGTQRASISSTLFDVDVPIQGKVIYPDFEENSYFQLSANDAFSVIGMDLNDYISYDRASNVWSLIISGASPLTFDASGLHVNTITEYALASGVNIEGVLLKDDAVETDAIRGLRESGGTSLAMGAVADGQLLSRSAATVAGYTLFDATNPAAIGTAAPGTSLYASHRDHVHAADSDDVAYVPTTAAHWDGAADPGDVEQALDQLAERIYTASLPVPAIAMWPSTTTPCAWPSRREYTTNDVDVWYMAFDPDADTYGQFSLVLPVWDQGTVTVTLHWTTVAAAGSTVCWSVQALSVANDGALDTAWGTAVAVTDTVLAAGDNHICTTGAITVAGAGAGELVQFRIMRDVSEDTCGSYADLLYAVVNYGKRDA